MSMPDQPTLSLALDAAYSALSDIDAAKKANLPFVNTKTPKLNTYDSLINTQTIPTDLVKRFDIATTADKSLYVQAMLGGSGFDFSTDAAQAMLSGLQTANLLQPADVAIFKALGVSSQSQYMVAGGSGIVTAQQFADARAYIFVMSVRQKAIDKWNALSAAFDQGKIATISEAVAFFGAN